MMSSLFLLILGVSGVCSDSHTLRYYYTAVSGKGSGLPEYSSVGYVDDQQIAHYNSDSRVTRPVAQWMNNEGSEYWEGETQKGKGREAVFRHNVRTAMSRFNQTGGLHSYQGMYGCELGDDGSTTGYDQDGYDGRDFLHLDTKSWIYIPIMHEAQISTQRWNSPDVRVGEIHRIYLQNTCIESLKRFITYGREDLEKRVRPQVKVTGHRSGEVTKLHCQVYGFHPRAVDVKWMRNGRDEVPSDEAKKILPHPDGTYQTRVSVEVFLRDEDTYSCYVDHSSLEEPLTVLWDPNENRTSHIGIIGGVVAVLLVLAIAVIGIILYRRRSGKSPGNVDIPTPNKEDGSSDSSAI
ncbi:class I histocompatibility antigen, F10 alpha chain-like isoform X2 [Pseudophryne corroboree]|uniref:class I histocompatibility antigen, F10 alpha chain-like isoform X2 n=1 Tax=Pseudophryne corroboree TaxID=495146 RepID=UPI003081225F